MSLWELVYQWQTIHYLACPTEVLDSLEFLLMWRRFCACVYEFLTTITEGLVHSVHKLVIRSSFGVIRRHNLS